MRIKNFHKTDSGIRVQFQDTVVKNSGKFAHLTGVKNERKLNAWLTFSKDEFASHFGEQKLGECYLPLPKTLAEIKGIRCEEFDSPQYTGHQEKINPSTQEAMGIWEITELSDEPSVIVKLAKAPVKPATPAKIVVETEDSEF